MPPHRKTQEERSAETRQLLHTATIESLMEVGYANTSTKGIAERAKVSRGAQTHHYPGKLDLIVAATEDMFTGFANDLEVLACKLRTGKIDFDGFIDEAWAQMLNGTWFYTSLEIIVAARGDAELRRQLTPLILQLHERFESIWMRTFVALNPAKIDERVSMNLVMNVLRGMAVQAVLRHDDAYFQEMLDAVKIYIRCQVKPLVLTEM